MRLRVEEHLQLEHLSWNTWACEHNELASYDGIQHDSVARLSAPARGRKRETPILLLDTVPSAVMATAETTLELVVRFSTSNPDLILSVDKPSITSIISLKQQIRAQLSEPASASRLRLIHSGKVLADTAALSKSVNVTVPPPPDTRNDSKSAKAKGKLPMREAAAAVARVYIHCSVGDALSVAELAKDSQAAQEADAALLSTVQPTITTANTGLEESTTTPAPRGFDRLLTAGFTATEVSNLRTQFLAIQSHSHTPDTMPSGAELLALEERWLDNTPNPATGAAADGAIEDDAAGGLEDMLYGNLIGFFWPIGAMMWLMREEGVWSRRRQIAVLSGFLVNLTFGFLRVMN